jgi:ADP-dependent NAD(P)H-hydrate dehydratase / NAD(P)H-hydrate epimerase
MDKSRFNLKKRKRDSHKGDYGHLLIIAGSAAMSGAAYLSSEAALLSGAGLVTLAIPKSLNVVMQRKIIEAMTLALPETKQHTLAKVAYKKIMPFLKKVNCVLIGPGLSDNSQTQDLIRCLIKSIKLPMVIDADALNALSGYLNILSYNRNAAGSSPCQQTVITPHPGEMARLSGESPVFVNKNKKEVAKKFSSEYNVTTVLKGYKTVVVSPGKDLYINSTGNPGMATAGCGDVLSGIIAALLSSGMQAFKAARLGVYIHGLSGDIAAKQTGEVSLRARDLLRFLPEAFKKVYG